MRTDELIELLSTNVEPVDHRQTARSIHIAIAAGIVVALGVVFITLGPRTDLISVGALIPALFKIAATAVLFIPASIFLIRLARPGGEYRTPVALIALPFITIMVLAVITLTSAPGSHWKETILSDE